MIKDYSLCWYVVFTRNIFPRDSLGVNFNCKIFEMEPPLCSAEYVVKPQCIGYSEKCIAHPTTSIPFLCKFFAPLMSYDGILKWIVHLLSAMQILNPGEWNTVHSGIVYKYTFSAFPAYSGLYNSCSLLPIALLTL